MTAEPARTPPADDDELPELPAIDGDDEPAGGELAIADELADATDEDEAVGLDAETGVEEDEDFLDTFEDDESTEDWEASDEPLLADPELGGVGGGEADEGGWTEGSEAADAEGWDQDLDDAEEPAAVALRDAGEEGVEELREGVEGEGEDDAPALAPLLADAGEDELADDLELEGEGEIDTAPGGDERPEHPALALPRALAEARWLGPDDDAIVAIGALSSGGTRGTTAIAGGRTIYRVEADRAEAIDPDALEGDEPTSIARTASGALIVGLQLGGAARSVDGRSFAPIASLSRGGGSAGAFHVLAEPQGEGAVRLWGRTRGGALSRSEDEGESWSRPLIPGAVIALALAADGGVVGVLGGRGGAPRVVRTADGGRSWRNLAGPPIDAVPDEHEVFVAALGTHLVIAVDGPGRAPFASSDDGQRWRRLDALRDAGALAIVREEGRAVLYAALLAEGRDRGLVARLPLEEGATEGGALGAGAVGGTVEGGAVDGGSATPCVVVDLEEVRARHHVTGAGDPEGDQRIHAIVAERRDGETTLWLASGIGVVRATIGARPRGAGGA